MRVRSADDGSSTDSRMIRLARVHAVSAARGDLVARHDLLLDVLGPGDRRLVVLQVVGELEQERVADRRSSWSGLRRTLSVKSISSRWMRSPTRWSTQRGDHVGESRSMTRSMISPAFSDHWNARSASSWISASCRCSSSSVRQHPADRRAPLRLGDALDDHPVQHLLDVLVAQHLDTSTRSTVDASRGHPLGVRRLRQPLAQPARDLRVAQLGLDDLRRHEVLPDEGAEALAELVLLALDDRGVRDRDAQRVLEQRGDREPVGERADHAGLGGGARRSRPTPRRRGPAPTGRPGRSPSRRSGNSARRPSSGAVRGDARRRRRVGAGERFGEARRRRSASEALALRGSGIWSVCHASIIRYNAGGSRADGPGSAVIAP